MRYDTRARATSRAGGGVRDALVEALEPRRLLSAAVPAPFAVGSARLPDGFELTPGGEVTVGHRIIFPGGSLESAAGGQSLIYDGDIGTFSASAEPSSFRPNATGAAVGHRVVFAGGRPTSHRGTALSSPSRTRASRCTTPTLRLGRRRRRCRWPDTT
jgi:hypothetical protein